MTQGKDGQDSMMLPVDVKDEESEVEEDEED